MNSLYKCVRPFSFRTLSIGFDKCTPDFTHNLPDPLICLVVKLDPYIRISNSHYRPNGIYQFPELFIHFCSEWNGQVVDYQSFIDNHIPEALNILQNESETEKVRCSLIVNPEAGMLYDKLRCGGDYHVKTGKNNLEGYHMTFSVRKTDLNGAISNSLLVVVWSK